MIKFLITHPITKRHIFGIGLTKRNIELLQKDKPIHFNKEDLNFINSIQFDEMLVVYGETEESLEKLFREKGYITEDTIITNLKRPTKQ